MKKRERLKLRRMLLGVMMKDPTWDTPCLQLRDDHLVRCLFELGEPTSRNNIYTAIRNISLKADDLIYQHWVEEGMDFEEAKSHVKYSHKLPLLIKIRAIGWKEPLLEDLSDDRSKKYRLANAGRKFAKRKKDRVQEIVDLESKQIKLNVNE